MFTELREAYQPRSELVNPSGPWENLLDSITRRNVHEESRRPPQDDAGHSNPITDRNSLTEANDEINSLHVNTPPRSPVQSVTGDGSDANSLYVRTPPRSPVLSLNGNHRGDNSNAMPSAEEDTTNAESSARAASFDSDGTEEESAK